MDISNLMIESS